MDFSFKENLLKILESANQDKSSYNRRPQVVALVSENIADVIDEEEVYLSEFIVAKIKGKIEGLNGHPEITDDILLRIPETIHNPYKIYLDARTPNRTKYLFVENTPAHQIVIEIRRMESGKTEINTIIPLGERTLKQLETNKSLQAVFSRPIGEAATFPSSLSQQGLSGVKGDESMIDKRVD